MNTPPPACPPAAPRQDPAQRPARKPNHSVVGAVLYAARQPDASDETRARAKHLLDRHPIHSAL